jgi:hypothetical protein
MDPASDMQINAPASTTHALCAAMATAQQRIEQETARARMDAEAPADPIFGGPAAYDEPGALARWLDCEAVIAQIPARPPQSGAEYERRVELSIYYTREDALRAAGDIGAIERNTIA